MRLPISTTALTNTGTGPRVPVNLTGLRKGRESRFPLSRPQAEGRSRSKDLEVTRFGPIVLRRFVAALRPVKEFLPQMARKTSNFEGFGALEAGTSLVASGVCGIVNRGSSVQPRQPAPFSCLGGILPTAIGNGLKAGRPPDQYGWLIKAPVRLQEA